MPHAAVPALPLIAVLSLLLLFVVLAFSQANRVDRVLAYFLFGRDYQEPEFGATLMATNAGLSGAFVLILYYGFTYGKSVFVFVCIFWLLTQFASSWTINRVEKVMETRGGFLERFGTMHEFIGELFESQKARRLAGLWSVCAYTGLVACELLLAYESIRFFLGSTATTVPGTSLEIYPFAFVVLVLLCIVVYCVVAGFRGVVKTDTPQFLIILGMTIVVLLFTMLDKTPVLSKPAVVYSPDFLNPDGKGIGYYLSFLFSNFVFWGLWWPGAMDQWQRCAAMRGRTGALDRWWGTVGYIPIAYFLMVSWTFVAAGQWLAQHLPQGTTISPELLLHLAAAVESWSLGSMGPVVGTAIAALVPVGLICAAMSTMDSYVMVATQCLFADVGQPESTKNVVEMDDIDHERRMLAGARATSIVVPLLIVVTALVISVVSLDVYEFIYFSFAFMFAPLPVLLSCLMGWANRENQSAAHGSLIAGGACCILGYILIIHRLHTAIGSSDIPSTDFWYQWVYWWPFITSCFAGLVLMLLWRRSPLGGAQ